MVASSPDESSKLLAVVHKLCMYSNTSYMSQAATERFFVHILQAVEHQTLESCRSIKAAYRGSENWENTKNFAITWSVISIYVTSIYIYVYLYTYNMCINTWLYMPRRFLSHLWDWFFLSRPCHEPLLPGCGVVPRSLLVMCACACLETATELALREHRKARIYQYHLQ